MKRTLLLILTLLLLLWGCAAEADSIQPTPAPSPVPDPPAVAMAKAMTTEEKVGQLFLVQHPIYTPIEELQTYHLGGFLFFGYDFADDTIDSMSAKLAAYQAAADVPMLMAVDEEGGDVVRISCHKQYRSAPFPSLRSLYDGGGTAAVLTTEAEKCDLLASVGINLNMSPVCDITNKWGSFMRSRSLGQDAQTTADVVSQIVTLMNDRSMGSALKHFPGYGDNIDTHTGIATDNRSLTELEQKDLIPFRAGMDAGCGAVLMSHTIVTCLDTEHPMSLSPAAHDYLRREMGFDGVIITDDLAMDAITDKYSAGEAAVLAVLAGNDILCTSEYIEQYEAVLAAARSGRIPDDLLTEAVSRILQWKMDLGLISQ
ncbi:MAG: beta-hexosaminidase [Oscillospiraceae bacterium]|nr:beta-hexosaminidase [Oscillospiraceae bacterium]